jgi:hypothetical protein
MKGDAGRAVDWLFALQESKAIEELQKYVKHMEKRGLSKSTQVRRMSTISSLSKVAYTIGASVWAIHPNCVAYGDARKKKAARKTRYTCPACQANAWAKSNAHLICGDCHELMQTEEREEKGDV